MKQAIAKKGGTKVPSFPQAPPAPNGSPLTILYGHNTEIKMVLMQFSATLDRVTFTPEEAEQAAHQLLLRARFARGEVVSG